jgi:hypothetical protein
MNLSEDDSFDIGHSAPIRVALINHSGHTGSFVLRFWRNNSILVLLRVYSTSSQKRNRDSTVFVTKAKFHILYIAK